MMDASYNHFSANDITLFVFMTKCNPIECASDVIKANVVTQYRQGQDRVSPSMEGEKGGLS